MKAKPIKALLLFLVFSNTGLNLFAQTSLLLCAGQKGIKYQVLGDVGSIFHWQIDGGQIISNPNNNLITVNWGNEPGNYTIKVYEEKPTGCLGNTKILNVTLQPSPQFNLGNIERICEGTQIEFIADQNGDTDQNKFVWQDGSTNFKYVANSSGIYWAEVTGLNGCSLRDSVTLVVNPLPKINLGKDTMVCAPDELVLDAGNFGGFYDWSTGDNSRTITAHENDGKIWVKVTDSNGCSGSDTIQLANCAEHMDLLIPKAFAPNNEASGNLWIIGGSQWYPNLTIKIYDRWGIMVYISDKGYSKPWDGKTNGKELPMDAYYYQINKGDGSKDIVGSVTIIR